MSTEPISETAPPVAHVEAKANALLVLMLLLILGSLGYVMYARGVFESTQQLVLVAEDAEGVLVGMDLTYAGFPVGRVQRIELADDGKARLLLEVPRKDARWLRTSSVFTMERGMVGDTRLRVFSGILSDPPLPDGAQRPVLRGDITAEIPRLIGTLRTLIENVETMTQSESALNQTLDGTQKLMQRLQGNAGALGVVLGSDANARKVITALDRTNALLIKADERLFGPKGVADDTQAAIQQLNAMLGESRLSLKKVDAVLSEAQLIATNARIASTDLGSLRAQVDASLRKVESLVNEINRKWPFARDTEIKLP
jgi:phospholipid/cholesterol/gamma-HCH transport system substrate-binding protein